MNKQTTIKKSVEIMGKGLHLGRLSQVKLSPLPINCGIQICYKNNKVRIEPSCIHAGKHNSIIVAGKYHIQSIEHLMAALHGCGISNCQILLSGAAEFPFLDGSAKIWVELLQKAKIVELSLFEKIINYSKAFKFSYKESQYQYYPSDDLEIDCTIDFPSSIIGHQHYRYKLDSASFAREIALCRTFLKDTALGNIFDFKKALERLPGLNVENYHEKIIICDHSQYLTALNFENEPVRHKILDFMGDIRNIGLAVRGEFHLYKPSHLGNIAFMKELYDRWINSEMRKTA